MKPLPEAVQAAFPCQSDQVPSRPWWRDTVRGWGMRIHMRTDFSAVRIGEQTPEAFDAANPLPHPGFRAGQVWAAEDGSSVALLAINKRNPAYPLMALDFGGDHEAVVDTWSTRPFSRCFPYLMADPACPWLAPWSPAENTP